MLFRSWKKSEQLGEKNYSIIVHGKHSHEETRATFSRSELNAPSLVIRDLDEAKILCDIILEKIPVKRFNELFAGKYSAGFDPETDLDRLGVINQTTMLASETQAIADLIRRTLILKFGEKNSKEHYADTRDTLCYATNENQEATYGLLREKADLAIVVGGYNSSNTSHIVELCEAKLPTFFISSAAEIGSKNEISHFDLHKQERISSKKFLPDKQPLTIILTSGASCPDSMVDEVLQKIVSFYPAVKKIGDAMKEFERGLK